MKYPFRNETTGKIRHVPFDTMMEADITGAIVINGTTYKRARDLEPAAKRAPRSAERTEIVSDALGFTDALLVEMEADRKKYQHHGVEFVEDRTAPGFYQVKCSSPQAFDRYARHRGFFNKSSKNGGAPCLTEADLESAAKLVARKYGSH